MEESKGNVDSTKRKHSEVSSGSSKAAKVEVREAKIDSDALDKFVEEQWKDSIVPTLSEFIKIPNVSPTFDENVHTNGYQEAAAELIENWVKSRNIKGASINVFKEEERTPLILIEISSTGSSSETVLMYGHFDKQPPMGDTWNPELGGPRNPVIKDGKLYGRGGADDGYSVFASVAAIGALQAQNVPHARVVILIEGCEESGSRDLPYYVEKHAAIIGNPSLVICLDSGCGNYEQFWLTTSLRGGITVRVQVKLLHEGVHSGDASGIVPSTFRIMRDLLDRLEDPKTGEVLLKELFVDVPEEHVKFARDTANTLQAELVSAFPFVDGGKPVKGSYEELQLNRTWRPTVSYTGISGIPDCKIAGNVLRAETTLNMNIRLPPTLPAAVAKEAISKTLLRDIPYGAQVSCESPKLLNGWAMPKLDAWLKNAVNRSSEIYFKKPARMMGEGGSIPFMSMLIGKFPDTQFVIAGVLGPKSNAHGPNEFLHIRMGTKLTACMASVIADHNLNV